MAHATFMTHSASVSPSPDEPASNCGTVSKTDQRFTASHSDQHKPIASQSSAIPPCAIHSPLNLCPTFSDAVFQDPASKDCGERSDWLRSM